MAGVAAEAHLTPEQRGNSRDIGFATGILAILSVFFLPIPPFIIDIGLAFSIALAVLILMVALWIQRPLDFSSFPTVLLVATLLRLSLNIATTRPDSFEWCGRHGRGGLCDRRILAPCDERRLRHRPDRLLHHHHGQLHRHYQGRDAHRGSRRALYARCHPRQADGDRRRSVLRHDRREGSAAPPPRA